MTNSSPSRIKKEGFQFSQLQISKRAYFIALSEFRATWNVIHLIAFISFLQDLFINIDIAFQYITTDISDITSSARFLNDLFNFHNLFSYNPPTTALLTVCSLIILYFVIVLISFFGVIYGTLKQKPPEYFLSKVWSYLIQVHAAVLFLPVSNVCARLQAEYRDSNLQFSGTSDINGVIFTLSVVINIFNILFAALPYTFLLTVLPSKNPLASKSIVSDRQILYHKLIISMTCLLLPDVPFTPWFVIILNFAFSALRFTWFFYTLPRYSFQMVRFELLWTKLSGFISAMTCFIFISNQAGASFTVVSVITGAVVILPVLIILNYSSCQWILRKILFASLKTLNPYTALHKVLMLKYLQREMKAQNERQVNFDKHYFYLSAMNTCPEKIFEISISPDKKVDLSKREVRHTLKRMFLESIVEQFRSSKLLKLILARFYARNLKLYPLAIKTLAAIKSQSSNIRASVDLLHVKIQNEVLEQSKGQQQKQLSIYEYIITSHQQEQFKDQIRKQVNLQQDFWKEYSKNEPGIVRLQTLAQVINSQKLRVSKTWARLEQNFPKSLNSLYLIYSQYHYVCNDSLPRAREYLTKHYLYAERETRVANPSRTADFKSSNMNTFSVTIRTDLKTLGNIAHCSRSIESVLGYDSKILIGSNLQTLMTPFVADRHNQFLQDYLKTGKSVFLGKTQSVFVKNEAGFLQKAYLNVNMHPFINQELLLTGLFQVFQDNYEYILVAPDGKIDSYTSGIASSLGLSNNRLSINSVCPDLDLVIPSNGDKTDFGFGSGPFNIAECITEDRLQTGERDASSFRKPLLRRSFSYSQKKAVLQVKSISHEFPKKQNIVFRHSSLSHNESVPRQTFEYECNISLNPVQNESMYIIEINPFDLRGENFEVASQKTDQVKSPVERKFSENLNDYELEEELERNNEFDQDEKRGGWLKTDIQHLNTPTENIFTPTSDARINLLNFTENNPILTFKTDAVTSARPILAKEKFLSEEHEEPTTQRRIQFERKKRNSLTNKSKSEISSSEAERRIQSCIQEGLKTMYFPKIILNLIGICLFTMPGLLVDQLYLGISASNNLHTIKSLTETLDMAISAVNTFARLDLQVRAAATVKMRLINPSSTLGISLYSGLSSAIANLGPTLKSTYGSLNDQIQEIDEVFQENFRRRDIKMYNIDSQLELNSANSVNFTYQEFDMFTAMTLLVDRCYRLRAQYTKSSTYSVEDLFYVLANSANDLFERVVSTVTDILQSTQNSIAATLKNLTWLQIICCVLLLIIVIIVYYHIYKVYQDEIRLMQQFVKISPPAISQLQNKINRLAKMLEDSPSNSARYFKLESDHSDTDNQNNSSAKIVKVHKTPDVKELKRNYLKKFFVFLVNLVCFYSIFSLMSWLTISHIGTFKQKVNRVYTTQTLVYQVSTLSFSLAQLSSNDTESRIMNMPVGEIIEFQLQNILSGVNGLFSVFQNGDGTVDPRFSAILSGNACDYVPSASKALCANIVKGATNIGLLSMLARIHSSVSLSYQTFTNSNHSATDVQTMITSYYTDVGLQIYVVRDILSTMVTQTRNDFYETWDQAGSRITLITCIDILLLSISGSVSLFYCFLEALLYFNKFKAVLKVVPTQILIKNSALKGLLIMSSNGKLDPIKNEI